MEGKTKIDLVTSNPVENQFSLILVEQGPWDEKKYSTRLREIQDRIYNVADLAIDGQICSKFPETKGGDIEIQIDCYDPPTDHIEKLAMSLNKYISNNKEYKDSIKESEYINSLSIIYREDSLIED